MFAGGSEAWIKVFAALIVLVMTMVNVVGSKRSRERRRSSSPW